MTEKRFIIEVLDKNNWLIEDTKTGETANPIDGTTNVLKGLISTLNKFNDENKELKEILGAILLEVKRDITNTNQTGEIKVFINPNSYEKISEILRKYGALKEWY